MGACGTDVFGIMYLVLFMTIQAKVIKMLLVQRNIAHDLSLTNAFTNTGLPLGLLKKTHTEL